MNIDDLTIAQVKEIGKLLNLQWNGIEPQGHPYEIGECYLIRTVTMIDTGRIVAVTSQEIVVEDAAWIADTGRFADALKSAEFDEVEPFPNGQVIISRGAIIDACQIPHAPRKQK
jgi:hypothetical protein